MEQDDKLSIRISAPQNVPQKRGPRPAVRDVPPAFSQKNLLIQVNRHQTRDGPLRFYLVPEYMVPLSFTL